MRNWQINNTQLFKRLNNVENEVKIIEKELPNYLFEFPDGMALENANNYFWNTTMIFINT